MRSLFLPSIIFVSLGFVTPGPLDPTPDPIAKHVFINPPANGGNVSFALFLPPQPGQVVGQHLQDAIPFGTVASGHTKLFPEGFITSATFTSAGSNDIVEVTGCFDRSKYGLSSTDIGAQFDSDSHDRTGTPTASSCLGFENYISAIEPASNRYCIRCCSPGLASSCQVGLLNGNCLKGMPEGNYAGCNK